MYVGMLEIATLILNTSTRSGRKAARLGDEVSRRLGKLLFVIFVQKYMKLYQENHFFLQLTSGNELQGLEELSCKVQPLFCLEKCAVYMF